MAEITEKTLNQSPQKLEEKILKAILKREDSILDVIEVIDDKCFSVVDYGCIYTAMVNLYKANQEINPENIEVWLQQNKYNVNTNIIQKLYNESFTSIKVNNTAKMIKELYQRRTTLQNIRKILEDQESNPTKYDDLLENINTVAMNANELVSKTEKNTKCFNNVTESLLNIQNKLTSNDDDMGIRVNLPIIDNELKGLKPRLYTICADASVGKSQFAIQLCVNAIKNNPELIIDFYELEMTKEETEERMLSCLTELESQYISNPKSYFNYFNDNTQRFSNHYDENPNNPEVIKFFNRLRNGIETIHNSNIYIDDTPDLTVTDLIARVNKNALKRGNPAIIVIDHINILCSSGSIGDEVSMLKEAYKQLKQLSKKLNCTVLVLHQFSKGELVKDELHQPNIFSLYGGSSARMYADVIASLYRADVYRDVIDAHPELKGYSYISFDKVRYCKKPDKTETIYTGYSFKQKNESEKIETKDIIYNDEDDIFEDD